MAVSRLLAIDSDGVIVVSFLMLGELDFPNEVPTRSFLDSHSGCGLTGGPFYTKKDRKLPEHRLALTDREITLPRFDRVATLPCQIDHIHH